MNSIEELPPRVKFNTMGIIPLTAYARKYKLGEGTDYHDGLKPETIAISIERQVRRRYAKHGIPYENSKVIDWTTLNLV